MQRKIVFLLCLWFPFAMFGDGAASRDGLFENAAGNPNPLPLLQVGTLIINEYLADPPTGPAGDANGDGVPSSTQDEFVELVNAGSTPIDISGFTISDALNMRFMFPSDKIIPAGEATVVFGGGTPTGDFGNATANGLVFAIGGQGLALTNGGDTITIRDGVGGNIVAEIMYGSAEGNANQSITRSPDITGDFVPHMTADGSGGRLFSPGARVNGRPFVSDDPLINSISPNAVVAGSGPVTVMIAGENFQAASQALLDSVPINTNFVSENELNADIPASVTAAPGAHQLVVQNPDSTLSNEVTFTVLSEIGINEYLADPPDGIAGDANGDGIRNSAQDEFIEVVNRTDAPIDVGGFSISDAAQVRFTFPFNTIIPAGEVAIIFGGGTPTGEFGNAALNGLVFTASLSLNNGGDTITLKDGVGGIVEEIVFGSVEGNANQSINRNPDILGTTFAPHSTIEDSGGSLFSPGLRTSGAPFTTGPRITGITPDSVLFETAPFDLSVEGSGFELASTVFIDSTPVATDFVNAGTLTAMVPESVTSVIGDHAVEVRNAGGNRSNIVTLTVIPPAPVLRSIRPTRVLIGNSFLMFALGENFTQSSVILIEDTEIATVFISERELRATVPVGFTATTGFRRVRIRNADGQQSAERAFEVLLPEARITSISPAEVTAFGPGFTLVVRGENFRESAMVILDHTPLETVRISSQELRAEVPAALIIDVGLRAVTVVNTEGAISNEAVFRVLPVAPLIHAIEPESAPAGAGDLTITITGEKFQPGAVVHITERGRFVSALVTEFITSERLEADLPARFLQSPGDVSLTAVNPDTGVSNIRTFKVFIRDPLIINEYMADPAGGAAGDANGDGTRSASQDEFIEIVNRTDQPIDISGYKLFDSVAQRHVFPSGTVIPPFEAVVVFGGGTPKGNFGNASENALMFTASSGGLSLDNGGDTIRLEDSAGNTVQEITFDAAFGNADQAINRNPDVNGADFARHATVAAGAKLIFSPGAKATGEPFTIKPSISAIAPASIRAGSSEFTLMVTGANFLPGAELLFGDALLETTRLSGTELEARVSAGLISGGGAVDVRARNPKGELSRNVKFLIFEDPPRIASITPQKTGTGAKDFEITIVGERFQRGARVTVEGEAVETIFIARDLLVAVVPDRFFERLATLEVRVLNADGNESEGVALVVENGPLLTRVPRKIKVGSAAIELAIGGLSFKSGIVLLVGEQEVPTDFISETRLTARIPAEMRTSPGRLEIQARNPDGGRSNIATIKVVQ
ncbi:MAG: lamin tail domain-containing protein [Blastocatellia bacterium]|nr:lamin tail domain-containing protein [Blastocatellia bacterium]